MLFNNEKSISRIVASLNKLVHDGINLLYYNRIFVLSFENKDDREAHRGYFLPKVEINDCNVMIDGRNVFHQPIKNDQLTYDRLWYIRNIAIGQGDDYTTDCLLDYLYFKDY